MPFYCYVCDSCGRSADRFKSIHDDIGKDTCRCGQPMRRDYRREKPAVKADPEACQADIDRNIDQRRRGKEVDRPILARSLARVPGVRKVRAKDGKVYGYFGTRQERARTLKRLGMNED